MVKDLCCMLAWFEAFGKVPIGSVERVQARAEEIERVAGNPKEVARVLADILPDVVVYIGG